MSDYYDDIIAEISTCLTNGQLDDAEYLLKRELGMPYIPEAAEKKLHVLQKELIYARGSQTKEKGEKTLPELLHMLKGRPASQLAAANALQKHNLRTCVKELQDYLQKDPVPEAAVLVIDALAEQEISEEFVWNRDGVEYAFYADEVVPVSRCRAIGPAAALLQQKLARNPSALNMAMTLLAGKIYMALPLTYEAEEAKPLAEEVIQELNSMLETEN